MLKYSPKPVIVRGSLYLRRGGIIISATKYETSMNRPVHSFDWQQPRHVITCLAENIKSLKYQEFTWFVLKYIRYERKIMTTKIMRANWNIKHNSCLIFDAIWRLAQFWPYFLVMQKSKMTKKIQCKAWESFIRTYKSLSICPFN